MTAETLSSHAQVTVMPLGHFAKVILQRGTIIMFMPEEVGAGRPPSRSSRSSACVASPFLNSPSVSPKSFSCP